MKVQIRRGVFETNSSSSHSLVIVPMSEYHKFERGEFVMDTYADELVPAEIAEEAEDDERYLSFHDYMASDGEVTTSAYTTKSGDEVMGIACYTYG